MSIYDSILDYIKNLNDENLIELSNCYNECIDNMDDFIYSLYDFFCPYIHVYDSINLY